MPQTSVVTDPALIQHLNANSIDTKSGDQSAPTAAPTATPQLQPGDTVSDPALIAHLQGATGEDQQPGILEDLAKTAGPGAVRALAGVAGMPADLVSLGAKGVSALGGPETEKFTSGLAPITSSGIMNFVDPEHRLYEPKTAAGNILQRTEQALPLLAAGPGGMVAKMVAALGSGAGGYGARSLAESYGASPSQATAADIIGSLAGGVVPTTMGAKLMPPINVKRPLDIQRMDDLGVKTSLGVQTGRPYLLQKEANVGESGQIEKGVSQFSTGLANKVGIATDAEGGLTGQAIDKAANDTSTAYGAAVARANITGPEFSNLINDVNSIVPTAMRRVRATDPRSTELADMADQITGGLQPTARSTATSITGERYQVLRGDLTAAIDKGGPLKDKFIQMKEALDEAMGNSLGGPELKQLQERYSNLDTIKGMALDENNRITPQNLAAHIKSKWGNEAYNRERGLSGYANSGIRILKPLPKAQAPEEMRSAQALSAGTGYAAGMLTPHVMPGVPLEPMTGAIAGQYLQLPSLYGHAVTRPIESLSYNNPMVRALLRSQTKTQPADVNTMRNLLATGQAPKLLPGDDTTGARRPRIDITLPYRPPNQAQ